MGSLSNVAFFAAEPQFTARSSPPVPPWSASVWCAQRDVPHPLALQAERTASHSFLAHLVLFFPSFSHSLVLHMFHLHSAKFQPGTVSLSVENVKIHGPGGLGSRVSI